MRARPAFLAALVLISAILCLSFFPGFARNVKTAKFAGETFQSVLGRTRIREKLLEFLGNDYAEPGANTNPRAGNFQGSPLPVPGPSNPPPPPPHAFP
ncbi:uncharacterized protein LOC144713476 [Wolffia australiana]